MPASGSRMLRRGVAAVFLLVAGGAVALGAGLALDGQGKPDLIRVIAGESPQIHRTRLGQQVTVSKQRLSPEDLAWIRSDAVAHPLGGLPLYLTGAGRGLQGDLSGGKQLVDMAIRRNPRLLQPRYWAARAAMEQKHPAEATDAILRVMVLDPDSMLNAIPVLVELTRFPESWPRLRTALAADNASWHEPYFQALTQAGFDPAVVFSAIDVANGKARHFPTAREQTALLSSMIAKGDFERAYTAWIGWLPPKALERVAFLYDGSFYGAPGAAPFNWTFQSTEGGSAEVDKGKGLRFDLTPRDPLQLASQTILLPPGRYRMQVTAMLDDTLREGEQMPLVWQLNCLPKRQAVAALRLPNATTMKAVAGEFEIPADCPAQFLSFDAAAMEFPVRMGGMVRSVTISEVK